jgi:uncharacterized YccA/Bax inhibitor family protein
LTRTALLLLLLLGHCSIPHSNVVVVAAICGVGIFASGDLGLLARRYSVSWGLNLLLCRMSGVVSVVVSTVSALAAIALLLQYVSEDHLVEKGASAYYCIDFLHDRSFSQVNGLSCADESYFSLDVATRRRGNIDLAAC